MAQKVEQNTFVQGIITEASPLTFPENASIRETNFVLNQDGSRQRRLGMEFEAPTFGSTSNLEIVGITTFDWLTVAENPNNAFGVIQTGTLLTFVNLNTAVQEVVGTLTLTGVSSTAYYQYASVMGFLVVVTGAQAYTLVEYSSGTFLVNSTNRLLIRDLFTVDDGQYIDERRSVISDAHYYNLYNQSWGWDMQDSVNDAPRFFYDSINEYPSNADIAWTGKDPSENEKLSPKLVVRTYTGTTYAPKGSVIIDLFNRGVSRFAWFNSTDYGIKARGFSSIYLPNDSSPGGLTSTAAYAGRVWFGITGTGPVNDGDKFSPAVGTYVVYSQIVKSIGQIQQCYQEADPTSEIDSDLVATDGGFINIPEAKNIIKLVPAVSSLIVLAENGVWQIAGQGQDEGFTAESFQVRRISDNGCTSPRSAVVADSTVMYFSDAGIYAVVSDPATGGLSTKNITEQTIQRGYDSLSTTARASAVGTYDRGNKTVRWLYNNEGRSFPLEDVSESSGSTYRAKASAELILDLRAQAFSVFNFPYYTDVQAPWLAGYLHSTDFVNTDQVDPVVVLGDPVAANTEPVAITEEIRSRGRSLLKYLTFENDADFGLSSLTNSDFLDWEGTAYEEDAEAIMITGYLVGDTSAVDKKVPYLYIHCERTEKNFIEGLIEGSVEFDNPSSVLVQSMWGFSDSLNSGRWGDSFEGYKLNRPIIGNAGDIFDYGFSVVSTKNTLRGKGNTLSLRFQTSPGKDLKLLGWVYEIGSYQG